MKAAVSTETLVTIYQNTRTQTERVYSGGNVFHLFWGIACFENFTVHQLPEKFLWFSLFYQSDRWDSTFK
jgi:hypothetical protein